MKYRSVSFDGQICSIFLHFEGRTSDIILSLHEGQACGIIPPFMTAEFVAASSLFLSDRFGVSFCLYEVRAYVIILSLHEGQACGRTQFFTTVSPHLSRNLETLKQTSSTLCRKIIQPDDTLYLPSIFCCQKYQHSGRENI